MTLSEIQKHFKSRLAGHYPEAEIRQIFSLAVEHLLNYSKIDTFLRADEPISAEKTQNLMEILDRLLKWEPIQYILGVSWFYGFTFRVNTSVLIPRQETEELVDWIVKSEKKNSSILDIGCGSGCISVSLAASLPGAKVSGCDVSDEALVIASQNAILNNTVLDFFRFDMLRDSETLPSRYDVIVSNPPYVPESEKKYMLQNVLEFEPYLALFVPDNDPLLFYKRIALLARRYLKESGSLYLEINERYPEGIVKLLMDTGFYGIQVKTDLNGKSRMVRAFK